jgi:hypothetical protein
MGTSAAERHFLRRIKRRRGNILIVRLPGVSPLKVATIIALAIAVALVAVAAGLGFAKGIWPTRTAGLAGLVAVLAGAVAAGWMARRSLKRGYHELTLDPFHRTILFPLQKRDNRLTKISFDQVERIEVMRKGKAQKTRYVPVVRWIGERGLSHTTAVWQFVEEREANAMREWLRQQLGITWESSNSPAPARISA